MASKKHFAAIDFQGAATIKIGGTAGNSQYLKTASNGLLQWASGTSNLTKKVYDIVWDSESGYSSAGVTWESGDAAGVVTITHSLGTQGVIVSVKDIHANVTDNVHEQIDLNYPSACVVKLHSNDVIKLIFDTEPAQNNEFYVTIIG